MIVLGYEYIIKLMIFVDKDNHMFAGYARIFSRSGVKKYYSIAKTDASYHHFSLPSKSKRNVTNAKSAPAREKRMISLLV